MDGFKSKIKNSLQFKLSFWISLLVVVMALCMGAISYFAAYIEFNEIQDDFLRQTAALFDSRHLPSPHHNDRGRLANSNEESRVIVQYLIGSDTSNWELEGPPLKIPKHLSDGIYTLNSDGEYYRVLIRTIDAGQRIAVSQETHFRDEVARNSAKRALMPFLVALPILLLIVRHLVRKIFAPISKIAQAVDQRSDQDLSPFRVDNLTTEIRPFVRAINRLLQRVLSSLSTQKRFIADAAHELRTPLAALSLQAESMADLPMSDQAKSRFNLLRTGIDRNINLTNQLLAFATAQANVNQAKTSVSIFHILREVIEDLVPLAEAKGIEIGVDGDVETIITANVLDITLMVKNIIDNAIRYSFANGAVNVTLKREGELFILAVADSGPGIPKDQHDLVFDPFYRVLGNHQTGSGLGLSIVKEIAQRVNATVHLRYADSAKQLGLVVTVTMPFTI